MLKSIQRLLIAFTAWSMIHQVATIRMSIYHDGAHLIGKYTDFVSPGCDLPVIGKIHAGSLIILNGGKPSATSRMRHPTMMMFNKRTSRGVQSMYSSKTNTGDYSQLRLTGAKVIDADEGLLQDNLTRLYVYAGSEDIEYEKDIEVCRKPDQWTLIEASGANSEVNNEIQISFLTPSVRWSTHHMIDILSTNKLCWQYFSHIVTNLSEIYINDLHSVSLLDDYLGLDEDDNAEVIAPEENLPRTLRYIVHAGYFYDLMSHEFVAHYIDGGEYMYMRIYSKDFKINVGNSSGYLDTILHMNSPDTFPSGELRITMDNNLVITQIKNKDILDILLPQDFSVSYFVSIIQTRRTKYQLLMSVTNAGSENVSVALDFQLEGSDQYIEPVDQATHFTISRENIRWQKWLPGKSRFEEKVVYNIEDTRLL